MPQGSILRPLFFIIFMNDLFLFIEKCHLYNYADENSLDSSTDNFTDVLHNLRHDGSDTIEWFATKMVRKQCNPDNFHFMLSSPTPTDQKVLLQCVGTSLMSETKVTVLGVTIDDELYFSQHISACCKKVARVIFPLVWHFCGQVNN